MILLRLFTAGLATATLATALAVVSTRHQGRIEFDHLQQLHAQRDRMAIDWGRLQLEQSTLAQHARVEEIARARLDMVTPERPGLVRLGR